MIKLYYFFSFILFCVSGLVHSIEFNGEVIQISEKYYSGTFLIFDCTDKHWSCVDQDGFIDCKKARDKALLKKEKNLACSPIKDLVDMNSCRKRQQLKVDHPTYLRHCFHQAQKKGLTR